MEDAEGLVATQAARQASESWKPVDRGGAVHLGARGGWAAVTSPREVVEEVVEEEEEVVVESDDDAGVAWTPYTRDDAQAGVRVPSSRVNLSRGVGGVFVERRVAYGVFLRVEKSGFSSRINRRVTPMLTAKRKMILTTPHSLRRPGPRRAAMCQM